jgi:6,7-dimethyl-8-ribityllumazine synthase|tara:strand:- start:124 stop:528 length:405 start_codon:yes stop_codon:yes gene_type:complete
MNKEILIVHTAWYQEYISKMLAISQETLEDFNCTNAVAPGALELAALAAQKLQDSSFIGVLFLGIVIRGETSHYELVTKETFRSISNLSLNNYKLAIINNVICVENIEQLEARLVKNSTNNAKALIQLIHEKSS